MHCLNDHTCSLDDISKLNSLEDKNFYCSKLILFYKLIIITQSINS